MPNDVNTGQRPVKHSGFPENKHGISEQDRCAAKHNYGARNPQQSLFNRTPHQLYDEHLQYRRKDQGDGGGVDAIKGVFPAAKV